MSVVAFRVFYGIYIGGIWVIMIRILTRDIFGSKWRKKGYVLSLVKELALTTVWPLALLHSKSLAGLKNIFTTEEL